MNVTQTNKALTFKKLSADIFEGWTADRSHPIGDAEKLMPELIGVPKAILENVVFCHQEDSNWPMNTGGELKKRFDKIFGVEEYNTTMDKFIKIRKEYENKLNVCKSEKNLLMEYKQEAEKKSEDLETLKSQQTDLFQRRTDLESQLNIVESRLDEIYSRETTATNLTAQKYSLEAK